MCGATTAAAAEAKSAAQRGGCVPRATGSRALCYRGGRSQTDGAALRLAHRELIARDTSLSRMGAKLMASKGVGSAAVMTERGVARRVATRTPFAPTGALASVTEAMPVIL